MIQNFVPAQRRIVIEYNLVFDDGYGNGYWFSCDEKGNVYDDIPAAAKENYNWCLNNSDKFKRFNEIVKNSFAVKDNAHGTCHCGNEVHLYDEYYGACRCEQCGQWYNLSGQELLPPEDWQENFDNDY